MAYEELIADFATSSKHWYCRIKFVQQPYTNTNVGHFKAEAIVDSTNTYSFECDVENNNGTMPSAIFVINQTTAKLTDNSGYWSCGFARPNNDIVCTNVDNSAWGSGSPAGASPMNSIFSNIFIVRSSFITRAPSYTHEITITTDFPIFRCETYEETNNIGYLNHFDNYTEARSYATEVYNGDDTNLNKAINYYAPITVWHTVNDVVIRAAWDGTFTLIDNANSFDVRNTLPFASVTDNMDLVIKLPLLINCTDTSDDFVLPDQTVPYASDVTDEATVVTKEPLLFNFIEDGITFDVTNVLPFDAVQETLGFLIPQEVTDRALEGSDEIRTTEEGDTRQTEIEL